VLHQKTDHSVEPSSILICKALLTSRPNYLPFPHEPEYPQNKNKQTNKKTY